MVKGIFFSPAGSTRRVTAFVTKLLAERLGMPYSLLSYTLPQERDSWQPLSADDIVVWGTPVYAGRIPNKTLAFVQEHIAAAGAKGICIAMYGGRHYDNTLAEMSAIMSQGGITPIAAAAVVARHVFNPKRIAPGRPSPTDFDALASWCRQIDVNTTKTIQVPGTANAAYYSPLRADGKPARFLKALPTIDTALCNGCGNCATHCPMETITLDNGYPKTEGVCIKCQACVLECPRGAIRFTDTEFLSHVAMLEEKVGKGERKSEFFIMG